MKKSVKVYKHVPVLLSDFSSLLPKISGIWIDGTFGLGGYSKHLLQAGADKLVAIDLDPDVISYAGDIKKVWPEKFKVFNANFCEMTELAEGLGIKEISGIIFDVGISSMQIDSSIRGFSLKNDGPLDMRMSKKGPSAKDFINEADEILISEVLYKYGEERYAKAIAKRIVAIRKKYTIDTTFQLVEIIENVLGINPKQRIHPATKSFQAIRVAINNELQNLILGLKSANRLLKIGGYLSVITFHSLEDRIVKRFFNLKTKNDNFIDEVKCIGGNSKPLFQKINKKPVIANEKEIAENPRARSAKLRIVEKVSRQCIKDIEPISLGLPEVSNGLRKFQCG